jgi:hypothetical protein
MTDRFLIYKGSGGLSHNLNGLTYALHLCETQKRKLIIDMKNHAAFKIKFSDVFIIKGTNIQYYDTYDVLDKNITYKLCNKTLKIDDISNKHVIFKDGKYYFFDEEISKQNKNINDNIIFHAGYSKYNSKNYNIQINDNILNKLLKETPIIEPYLSVHFRNTDKKNDINTFIKKIKTVIEKTNITTIYIATDYYDFFTIIQNTFPNLKIIRKTLPEKGIRNLHYSTKNKFDEIYECLRDIFYISRSSYFIPSTNSGMSQLAINLINGKNSIIPLKSKTIIEY